LIPITGPPRRTPKPEAHPTDPTFWDRYYKTHEKESPNDLLETVSYLGRARKFEQVEAAIMAYLRYHSTNAEPWMYESLAVAMELNKRSFDQVRTSLGYASFLARKSRNPEHMTMVADLLFLRGYVDNYEVKVGKQTELVGVGVLVDEAAEIAPHLPTPAMMSANLAQMTRDPKRMADALERLLSLGWPGIDEMMRFQARRAAEVLAKKLREDDRSAEADTLLAHLAESEGRDLYVRLSWSGEVDIDLSVQEPLGAIADHFNHRTVFGGALVKANLGGPHAEEVYVCPRGFDGDYTIRIEPIDNVLVEDDKKDPKQPPHIASGAAPPVREVKLEIITHEGLPNEHKDTQTIAIGTKPISVIVKLSGGRRKTVLPFVASRPFDPAKLLAQPAPPAGKPATVASKPDAPAGKTSSPARKPTTPRVNGSQDAAAALGSSPRPAPQPISPGTGKSARPKPAPIVVPADPPARRSTPGTSTSKP
jgi:hypothetical protein